MLKETALETLSNSFLEKEKELQNQIRALEERLEVLNRSSALLLENAVEKVCNLAGSYFHKRFVGSCDTSCLL